MSSQRPRRAINPPAVYPETIEERQTRRTLRQKAPEPSGQPDEMVPIPRPISLGKVELHLLFGKLFYHESFFWISNVYLLPSFSPRADKSETYAEIRPANRDSSTLRAHLNSHLHSKKLGRLAVSNPEELASKRYKDYLTQKPERSPAFDLDARDALFFMIHHDELRADTDPTSVFVEILDLILESWKHPEGTFDRERIGKLDDMIQERAEEEADEREREKYYHIQILFQSAFIAPLKFFLSSQNSAQINDMLKLALLNASLF